MTVIAYRDGIMCADTARWDGDVISGYVEKIKVLPDGSLFACAGSVDEIELVTAWAMGGFYDASKPKLEDNFGALMVTPDGKIIKFWKRLIRVPSLRSDWEIEGSHDEFLSGALTSGATAAEAVKAAIERCAWAGGTVQIVGLNRTTAA